VTAGRSSVAAAALIVVMGSGTIAEGEAKTSLFDHLRHWLHLGQPVAAALLKGDHDRAEWPALGLWTADRDGRHVIRVGTVTGLRTPVFCHDRQDVVALSQAEFVTIDVASGRTVAATKIAVDAGGIPGLSLLGCAERGLLSLARDGRVFAFDLASGSAERLGQLTPQEAADLLATSRQCGDTAAIAGEREAGVGDPSTDRVRLFVRKRGERVARRLQLDLPLAVATDPAFSGDCRKLVFVGAESW
jgi:hypothetical protein